jgi:hypothetical protein
MMKRTTVNLLVDALAALSMLGMLATGYVLRFPLPPGTNKELSLWGLTRHQWGAVHFWLSLGLLAAVGLHLFLHWAWVVSTVGRRLHLPTSPGGHHLLAGVLTSLVLVVCLGLFAWAAHTGVREITGPLDDACVPTGPVRPADTSPPPAEQQSKVVFWKDVYPIFERSCLSCHGPRRQKGSFRVDRREDFLRQEGGPLVVPGKSADSPLLAILSGTNPEIALPDRHRLPERDVAVVRAWIDSGASWPEKR